MLFHEMQIPQRSRFRLAVFRILHFRQIRAAAERLVFIKEFRPGSKEEELAERSEKGERRGMILVKRESSEPLGEGQKTRLRHLLGQFKRKLGQGE